MTIQRKFLDWTKNPLLQATDWFLKEAKEQWLDLSQYLVVLPGQHASGRLLELLVEAAEKQSVVLTPPTLLTAGELPEHLYQPERPFASDIQQILAWKEAFGQVSSDSISSVFPKAPKADEFSKWMGLVQTVDGLHRDLASQMCSFRDAKEAAESLDLGSEIPRWEFLWSLQTEFWKVLEQNDLWDKQTARRLAVTKNQVATENKVVLVGSTDLPLVVRHMLKQISGQVTSLVFCKPEETDAFDDVGCIEISRWVDREIQIDPRRLTVAQKPEDQARVVLDCVRGLEGQYSPNQIVVGLPDDRLAPELESQFSSAGLRCRLAKGRSVRQTECIRLINAIGEFLSSGEYAHFAALVRHPIFSEFIDRRMGDRNWIHSINSWFEMHLPYDVLDGTFVGNKTAGKVVELVQLTLKPLSGDQRHFLREWPEKWNEVFHKLFENLEVDKEEPEDRGWIVAMKKIATVFQEVALVPDSLTPKVKVDDFLDLVLRQLQNVSVPEDPSPEYIDMLGWLDLPMDDASVAILTSFNEGFIPSSDAAHPFLNQLMRRKLGLLDNRRRYARDAYALELFLNSKKEFHLIVGKFSSDDEPLIPSRLALALSGAPLARRAKFLFAEGETGAKSGQEEHGRETPILEEVSPEVPRYLQVPRPTPLAEPITELRVTDFSRYLACPYRFYLQRVRGLRSWDDLPEEMEGNHFGSLIHAVLEEFAKNAVKDSVEPSVIAGFLKETLYDAANTQFGKRKRPAIRIQVKQAELRLDRFATLQAFHRQNHWAIQECEAEGEATWFVGDHEVKVVGRIDRIDIHEQTGQIAVWDYKTGDSVKTLNQLYFKKDEWVDLQLPLYRHLIKSKYGSKNRSAQLGVIALPKKLDKIEFQVADWEKHQFDAADKVIESTIESILEEVFWPPSEDEGFDPGIERICQSGVMKDGAFLGE